MAHSAMAGSGWGTTEGDDPLQTAVWRLRSRGCWADAAALLEPVTADTALQRTALLVERCLYTEQGWAEAEDALRTAEALAHTDDERGAAACERGSSPTPPRCTGCATGPTRRGPHWGGRRH